MILKFMENLEKLSVYELFPGKYDQNYHAIHTLSQLNYGKENLRSYNIKNLNKTFDKINSIRKHLSEYSIHPYLMLKDLNGNEKKILKILSNEILPNFIWNDELKNKIKKIENPSKDNKFMKNLLYAVKSSGDKHSSNEFRDSLKAEKLLCFYSGKDHIPWIIKELKSASEFCNQYHDSTDSLED